MQNVFGQVDQTIRRFFRRFIAPYPDAVLLVLAVSVGLTAGLGVWLFRHGYDFIQYVYRDALMQGVLRGLGAWAIIPILGLAGLIIGFLMAHLIGEERHHGVAGIIEANALSGGRLRVRRMPIKAVLSALSIGAGASTGPEDMSVQIGANFGSLFGQTLRMSDERVKLLVAAGAASGIAAAFDAPIAGIFFALEIVLSDFSTSSFGVVVLAAVIASILTRAIDPSGPDLGNWSYALGGVQEVPLYILLGLIIAPLSALFIRVYYWQADLWHHLKIPAPLKTLLAGLLVGLIAVAFPQVMGTGHDTMNQLLGQKTLDLTFGFMIALAAAKMLATTISLGGGFVGGVFAPSLFVGAALGRAYGRLLLILSNGTISASPAAFAMTGMAAAMTGVIRAPITAVILLFELTNDYNLILPILLTTVICLFVVERMAPDGIYQLGLARKGFRVSHGRDVDVMQGVTVGEAMSPNVQTIPMQLPLSELAAEFEKTHTHGLLVVDSDNHLYGIVTLQDYERSREQTDQADQTVATICTRDLLTVTTDQPISSAFHLMAGRDLGRLPVVASDNPAHVIGILRRRDIAKAYELALQRKIEGQYQHDQLHLAAVSNAHILELRVNAYSAADQHQIREVAWPKGSIVAAIQRNRQTIIPQGDTVLRAGDVLTVVTLPEREAELTRLITSNPT